MEQRPQCPKCEHEGVVKNGFVKEIQRWKCKSCRYEFTRLEPRGKSIALKAWAIALVVSGLSFRATGQLLKVSGNAVSDWVKTLAQQLPNPPKPAQVTAIEVDELWHFIQKKQSNSGYGLPWIVIPAGFLDGSAEIVVVKPLAP